MSNYVIVTESASDLSAQLVEDLGLIIYPLSFTMDGVTRHDLPSQPELSSKDFFDALKNGSMSTTAATNVGDYTTGLTPHLEAGKDVLILSFSSTLSATCQSALLAAEELREQFPDRTIEVVDSYCACGGLGLFVYMVAQLQKQGKSLNEAKDWAESNKMNVCHWFTVDDLNFLKRGGRVSGATALMGTMLSIKPILHVDNDGNLTSYSKARGRNASLKALVDRMDGVITDTSICFLNHGDCLEDAMTVKADIESRYPNIQVILNSVGPVIGSHTGPHVMALFFMGNQR